MGILHVALNTMICMILYITRDGVRGVIVPTIQYVIVSAVPYIYIYIYIYGTARDIPFVPYVVLCNNRQYYVCTYSSVVL